ncbi:MAG: AAA family ATPase, partial [Halofilum sp. (in: g-proteobacteria)]
MHATPETAATATGDGLTDVLDRTASVILGKRHVIRLALSCLLARGHLLLEDVPGVGKTTLAHALAHVLHLQYRRIQFTSDLLPADVLGTSVFERGSSTFRFHPGPVFAELVLADEINRAPPKTQSALLEAMEEEQVTIEGQTRALPDPFFVIATQNPREQAGTYPLPESQLDRFLMRLSLGFPGPDAERELLSGQDRRQLIRDMEAVLDPARLRELQARAEAVHVAPAILDYVQA